LSRLSYGKIPPKMSNEPQKPCCHCASRCIPKKTSPIRIRMQPWRRWAEGETQHYLENSLSRDSSRQFQIMFCFIISFFLRRVAIMFLLSVLQKQTLLLYDSLRDSNLSSIVGPKASSLHARLSPPSRTHRWALVSVEWFDITAFFLSVGRDVNGCCWQLYSCVVDQIRPFLLHASDYITEPYISGCMHGDDDGLGHHRLSPDVRLGKVVY